MESSCSKAKSLMSMQSYEFSTLDPIHKQSLFVTTLYKSVAILETIEAYSSYLVANVEKHTDDTSLT